MNVRVSKIERSQNAGDNLAVDESVDGSSPVSQVKQVGRLPSQSQVEFPTDCEHRIPDLLELESMKGKVSEQADLWIATRQGVAFDGIIGSGSLLINRTRKDQPMDGFDAPTAGDETAGQPIQQFGMARR